jgi:peptide deformylase
VAILPLKYMPDPILRRKSRSVKEIDSYLLRLIDDMIETMHAADGVGLAANQVGVPLRVAVIQQPEDEEATVLVNPKIVRREGNREVVEGCLSIPGRQGLVRRSLKVRVRALNRDGKPVRIRAQDNLLAQVLEHELAHLNGGLYVDHLVSEDQFWTVPPFSEEEDGKTSPSRQPHEADSDPRP